MADQHFSQQQVDHTRCRVRAEGLPGTLDMAIGKKVIIGGLFVQILIFGSYARLLTTGEITLR
jgi:hypothetical protein